MAVNHPKEEEWDYAHLMYSSDAAAGALAGTWVQLIT
jgi:hypothetical protein